MTFEEKVRDIKEHPERHQHYDFNDLNACCMHNGALDMRLADLHEEISTRRNGGRACDVRSGPCSCGAWHR